MRFFLIMLIFGIGACQSTPAATETPTNTPTEIPTSTPAPPWFGISFNEAVTDQLMLFVDPGGPAERAGIENNDILIALDGEPVTPQTLVERFQPYRAGDTIVVTVERNGEQQDIRVTLGMLPTGLPQQSQIVTQTFMGITLEITDAEVIIIGIDEDSPASETDIQLSDVVTAVDGNPIEAPSDVLTLLAEVVPGTDVTLTLERGMDVTLSVPGLIPQSTPAPTLESPDRAFADAVTFANGIWTIENADNILIFIEVGIQTGDRILSVAVDGQRYTRNQLIALINEISPEDEITLLVERGDETFELVGPGELVPTLITLSNPPRPQDNANITSGQSYGIEAVPDRNGFVVLRVSTAQQADILPGDIIIAIEGIPIDTNIPLDVQLEPFAENVTLTILRDGETLTRSLDIVETQPSGGLPFPLPIIPTGENE